MSVLGHKIVQFRPTPVAGQADTGKWNLTWSIVVYVFTVCFPDHPSLILGFIKMGSVSYFFCIRTSKE